MPRHAPSPGLPSVCLPSQVVVSLKRMEDDPLKETLDNVLPLNGVRCAALCVLRCAVRAVLAVLCVLWCDA